MKKAIITAAVIAAAVGIAGAANALDVGGAIKAGAKEAGKGVVEQQINSQLAGQNCAFKGKTTEATCNFNAIVAALKAGQTTLEKSGQGSLSIKVEAYGPDNATAKARADAIRNKVKPLFGSWSYDVYEKTGGNDLTFSVKVH